MTPTNKSTKSRLIVFYAPGAIGPVELARTLTPQFDPMVIVPTRLANDVGARMLASVTDVVVADDIEPGMLTGCDGIVTYSDEHLISVANAAAVGGLPGWTQETALAMRDKNEQRRLLSAAGLPVPKRSVIASLKTWRSAIEKVGFPLVLKPVRGNGSRNTFFVTSMDEAAIAIGAALAPEDADAAESEMLAEKYLEGIPCGRLGDYCSVESIGFPGAPRHHVVLSKFCLVPPFRETGQIWPDQLTGSQREAVLDTVDRALDALGATAGVTSTEVKLTPLGPRVIEVNGRVGGYVNELLRHAGGSDPLVHAAEIAVGRNPKPVVPAAEGILFQFNHLAPPETTKLVAVHGMDRVRDIPGVISHRLLLAAGSPFTPGVQTRELDMLNARVDSVNEMFALLKAVADELVFEFIIELPDRGPQTVKLSAHELPSAAALTGAL